LLRGFAVLKSVSNAMGRALRERDPCYAAATYALCEALFTQRTNQVQHQQAYGIDNVVPVPLYASRTGEYSLSAEEPKWAQLEDPDSTGFRGITSHAVVQGTCEHDHFTNEVRARRYRSVRILLGLLFRACSVYLYPCIY
jgi:hypothetical protein